jgi:hypothetical protein
MREMAQGFYNNLYMTQGDSNLGRDMENIPSFINDEMNAWLSTTIIDVKIEKALFHLGALKSLGHNGLSTLFYQLN